MVSASLREKMSACAPLLKAVLLAVMLCLCVFTAASLQGCRYTDVLTEHIEDEELGELDPDADPLYVESEDAEEDSRRSSVEVKESDRTDEQEESVPTYDADAEEDGVAVNRTYDEESSSDNPAVEGDETSEEEEEESQETQTEETNEQVETGEGESDDSEAGDESGGEGNSDKEGTETKGSGIGGTGTVYDTTGENQELPENCSKVAATGIYATIVQMLAGKGGLVAVDAGWQSSVKERGLFSGEGTQKLAAVWYGSASSGYTLDVDALIEAKPDAILVDGTTVVLTEAQKKKIQDASIDIITVPTLGQLGTPDDSILTAVGTVGELLKNSTTATYDTQSAAETYEEMHDATIEACLSANGGYSTKSINGNSYNYIYQDSSGKGVGTDTTSFSSNRITTAFIASWASSKSNSVTAVRKYSNAELYLNGETLDASDGYGLSATVTGKQFALMDYYLQVSGVVNNAYDTKRPTASSSGGSTSPYAVIAGSPTDIGLIKSDQSIGLRTTLSSALWYSPTSASKAATWLTVGDTAFPGVLAESEDIAKSVVSSAGKSNGLYNVGQSYKVWVVPSGIDGSWSTGTPESFLMSVWALKTFWGGSDTSEACDSYVNQYYQTFYRCSADTGTSTVKNYDTSYTAGS